MSLPAEDAAIIWAAWREMNAVRARDGVPYGHHGGWLSKSDVSPTYWSNIVDGLARMLGDECQPWPSDRMKPHVPAWSESE